MTPTLAFHIARNIFAVIGLWATLGVIVVFIASRGCRTAEREQ